MYYGLKDAGCEVEFEIVSETEKAYLLVDDSGFEFWMPQAAFDDTGTMMDWALPMLEEKYEEGE